MSDRMTYSPDRADNIRSSPFRYIGPRDLIKVGTTKYGYLGEKTGRYWKDIFVILKDDYLYIYKNNKATSIQKTISLHEFNRVCRCSGSQASNCFSLLPLNAQQNTDKSCQKPILFNCMGDEEQLLWIRSIHGAMRTAHGIEPLTREQMENSDYHLFEKPILEQYEELQMNQKDIYDTVDIDIYDNLEYDENASPLEQFHTTYEYMSDTNTTPDDSNQTRTPITSKSSVLETSLPLPPLLPTEDFVTKQKQPTSIQNRKCQVVSRITQEIKEKDINQNAKVEIMDSDNLMDHSLEFDWTSKCLSPEKVYYVNDTFNADSPSTKRQHKGHAFHSYVKDFRVLTCDGNYDEVTAEKDDTKDSEIVDGFDEDELYNASLEEKNEDEEDLIIF